MWDNNWSSQGPSSAAFLEGEAWGDWNGAMVTGIMGIGFGGTPIGQRIDVFELSDDGTEVIDVTEMTLPLEAGRFRSVVLGRDGGLYSAVDEGMIHKLTPRHPRTRSVARGTIASRDHLVADKLARSKDHVIGDLVLSIIDTDLVHLVRKQPIRIAPTS